MKDRTRTILKILYCLNKNKANAVASKIAIVEVTDQVIHVNIQCSVDLISKKYKHKNIKKHLEKILKKPMKCSLVKKCNIYLRSNVQ
ncbi:hypothetical protein KHA80_03520 [Anaerobacillus sp. HL2]|nr:hypothetical protein KHA80_03520 [Anaerobacillus sp. HL2]